jgi:hypothetical protein
MPQNASNPTDPVEPIVPETAPEEPAGSGEDVPPASNQESGQSEPDPEPEASDKAPKGHTQAEVDAKLAAQRVKLQGEHNKQIREMDLRFEAAKLAPGLGVEPGSIDVLLANIDRKALAYTEAGKPSNLGDVLGQAIEKIAAAVGVSARVNSGLSTSPAGSNLGAEIKTVNDFPKLGTPGLFKR